MCVVWGSEEARKVDEVQGVMDIARARRLLDEVMAAQPLVQPNMWGEPLLIPELETVIRDIKVRGLALAMNTNGLRLTPEVCQMLIDLKVDAVMASIDAVTRETLQKVRGIDKLDKIERGVERLLDLRGDGKLPRIGVSFTVQDANRHEQEAFVEHWCRRVDVVRIGLLFDDSRGTFPEMAVGLNRRPCPTLYNTLPVHNDGTVRMCCLDGFRATNMGNVFEDGVVGVWHGSEFSKARYFHETGQWDKVPFCKNCNGWAENQYEEEVRDGMLIRRSPQFVYYNRIDQLKNWSGRVLGGHKPPNISDKTGE
jgi:MoaA/NifB/PqqE/SkfB family radical SAM enzyme